MSRPEVVEAVTQVVSGLLFAEMPKKGGKGKAKKR
jgi:hypothetical protein